jgi:alkylation response protein AidB-like acyl-CoA dehydrogenase
MSAGEAAELEEAQREVAGVVRGVMGQAGTSLSDAEPGLVAGCRRQLAKLGLWTLGAAEQAGGGGAAPALAAAALMEIAAVSPALAWACAQAHAAVALLGDGPARARLRTRVHQGEAGIAVLAQASSPGLVYSGGTLSGRICRVDAADEAPWIIVLTTSQALLLAPGDVHRGPLRRTGFDGALTCWAQIPAGTAAEVLEAAVLEAAGTDPARCSLWNAGVAIAAGIATAATGAAQAYCAQRHQFGGPLTRIGAVRDELFQAQELSAGLRLAAMAQRPDVADAAGAFDLACEAAIDAAALAVQLHGGYGYLAEYRVERLLRDAISLRAAGDAMGARRAGAAISSGATP